MRSVRDDARILAATLLLLAVWSASIPDDARGCAPAMRTDETVDVAHETALIIWDEATQTEHFIRQAQFVGTALDFGFLVPTPNRPYVEAIDPGVFATLARITEPKTEYRTESRMFNAFGCAKTPEAKPENPAEPALAGNVIVLEQKRVGNFDSTVLKFRADKTGKFDDAADELLGWLNRNGYVARPELKEWLKIYIENKWAITAFKIAGEPAADQLSSARNGTGFAMKATPIRMTFQTERPFFPYREPVDQRDAQSGNVPRSLRLFVAAQQRMEGTIGESTSWSGQTVWANAITDAERTELLGNVHLPRETFHDKWWITEFEDRSTPRNRTDELYLAKSNEHGTVGRPVIVVTNYKTPWWVGPIAVILLLILGGAGFMLIRYLTSGSDDEEPLSAPPPPLPSSRTTRARRTATRARERTPGAGLDGQAGESHGLGIGIGTNLSNRLGALKTGFWPVGSSVTFNLMDASMSRVRMSSGS